jgi:predicted site-specific integrase-resolvase
MPTAETERRLGVSRWTVKRLVQQGYLEPVRVLGTVRYRESDVERIVREGAPGREAA